MKKLFTIVLVFVLSLMVVGSAFANGPVEPVCPEGMITVTPAEWVPEVCACPEGYEDMGEGVCRLQVAKEYYTCPAGFDENPHQFPNTSHACRKLIEGVRPYCPAKFDQNPGRFPNGPRACRKKYGQGWEYQPALWITPPYFEFASAIFNEAEYEYAKKECEPGYWEGLVCRDPDEVIVGASLRCAEPDSEGTCWQLIAGVTVDPAGGAILTFDDTDYTASQSFHTNFGNHEWSAVASTGYAILGDDSGSLMIMRKDCNEPGGPDIHIGTGPSGQPINLPLVILIGLISVSALSAGAFAVKRSRL